MSARSEPFALTATEALEQISQGTLDPVDWVKSCAARIDEREAEIHAWAHVDTGAAIEEAAQRWRITGKPSIPIGAKDTIDVVGMPTRMGTPFASSEPVRREGGSVSLLREGGCVFMGKTVTTELGHRHPGPTRNPHNPAHTPGGSSSGSAAAVADLMVPVALGTQTSGSVIRPAAYCGVIGYKPTYGDFDQSGILANAPSMDTLGLMARSIDDVCLLRALLLQRELTAPERPTFDQMTVAVLRAPPWDEADTETHDLIEGFVRALAMKGAKVVAVRADEIVTRLSALHRSISGYEFKRSIAFERIHHYDELSEILRKGRLADGDHVSPAQYHEMRREVAALRLQVADLFTDIDALIWPSAPGPALPTLLETGDAGFHSSWSLAGNPTITLPLFSATASGLPIGCQLIGSVAQDDKLLAIAATVMRAFVDAER